MLWAQAHSLTLNPIKTQCIIIGNQNSFTYNLLPNVMVMNTPIPFSDTVKNLSVIFDVNLNWSAQVSSICKRVHLTLCQLYKFRSRMPTANRKRLILS
jgi:hypothetical protein